MLGDLVSRLAADATLTSSTVIGSGRVWARRAPQGVYPPYVIVHQIASRHEHEYSASLGLAFSLVQVDVYAPTVSVAEAGADAVRERLDGFKGTMGSTVVRGIFLESVRDDVVPEEGGRETAYYGIQSTFEVEHVTTVPTF